MKKKAMPLEVQKKDPAKFDREQILASDRFRSQQDMIRAIWKDDSMKSIEEIEAMIEKYRKGQVK